MACPRPGWPDHRACGAGRGQAIAPPIDGFLLISDLGCENSLSGGGPSQKWLGLPINRETTKDLTDLGRYNSLSRDYDRGKLSCPPDKLRLPVALILILPVVALCNFYLWWV
jgi:hypothetical protein